MVAWQHCLVLILTLLFCEAQTSTVLEGDHKSATGHAEGVNTDRNASTSREPASTWQAAVPPPGGPQPRPQVPIGSPDIPELSSLAGLQDGHAIPSPTLPCPPQPTLRAPQTLHESPQEPHRQPVPQHSERVAHDLKPADAAHLSAHQHKGQETSHSHSPGVTAGPPDSAPDRPAKRPVLVIPTPDEFMREHRPSGPTGDHAHKVPPAEKHAAPSASTPAGPPSTSVGSSQTVQAGQVVDGQTLAVQSSGAGSSGQGSQPGDSEKRRINLAASGDGASVVAANKEAKKPEKTIDSDDDSYMKNHCPAHKWIIVELSQLGRVDEVELVNKEMYSSRVKDFSVRGRQSHPRKDGPAADYPRWFESDHWQLLGNLTAANKKGAQLFRLPFPSRVRYVLFQFHTHYGNEEMCALNSLSVYGVSAAQELEEALAAHLGDEATSAPTTVTPSPPSNPATPHLQPQPAVTIAATTSAAAAQPGSTPAASSTNVSGPGGMVNSSAAAGSVGAGTRSIASGRSCSAKDSVLRLALWQDVCSDAETMAHTTDSLMEDDSSDEYGAEDEGYEVLLVATGSADSELRDSGNKATASVPNPSSPGQTNHGVNSQVKAGPGAGQQHPQHPSPPNGMGPNAGAVATGLQASASANNTAGKFSTQPPVPPGAVPLPTPSAPPTHPPMTGSVSSEHTTQPVLPHPPGSTRADPPGHSSGPSAQQAPGSTRPLDCHTNPSDIGCIGTAPESRTQATTGTPASISAGTLPAAGTEQEVGVSEGAGRRVRVVPPPEAVPSSVVDSLLTAVEGGPAAKPKQAGNLFDIFKQEFVLLRLNQTRTWQYITGLVEVINRNMAESAQEMDSVEAAVAAVDARLSALPGQIEASVSRRLSHKYDQQMARLLAGVQDLKHELALSRQREWAMLLYCSAVVAVAVAMNFKQSKSGSNTVASRAFVRLVLCLGVLNGLIGLTLHSPRLQHHLALLLGFHSHR